MLSDTGTARIADHPFEVRVGAARTRALRHLLEVRSPGGWWSGPHDVNAVPAALYSIMLRTTGAITRPGATDDETRLLRHMITQTNKDGGFYKYPGSPSCRTLTRVALIALRLVMGTTRSEYWPVAWLARNGTIDSALALDISAVVGHAEAFLRNGNRAAGAAFEWDFKPLEMLIAAHVDQTRYIPPLPLLDPKLWAAVEMMPRLADQLNTLTRKCLPAVSILYGRARSRNRVSHRALDAPGRFEAFRKRQDHAIGRLAAIIRAAQNDNGGWFYNGLHTMLNMMALREAGARLDDPAFSRGLAYLQSNMVTTAGGNAFLNFMNTDVWDTGVAAYAYLTVPGHTAVDEEIRPAIEFLLRCQSDRGGFAWGSASHNDPDNDSTGLALLIFSLAEQTADRPLGAAIAQALDRGRAYLLEHQDPRGGFSVWRSTVARAGPGSQGLIRQCLFDVATPDVTSRILRALSSLGLSGNDARIRRTIGFLLRTQCRDGAWWSRWWAGYVPGSSFVISALSDIGLRYGRNGDLSDPLLRRAQAALCRSIEFLVRCQHTDGGWGETVAADISSRNAGRGSTTPLYTALTITALLRAGYPAGDPVIRRGMEYLLDAMNADGFYPDHPATFTFIAGTFYYQYGFLRHVLPLWAFNEYLRAL